MVQFYYEGRIKYGVRGKDLGEIGFVEFEGRDFFFLLGGCEVCDFFF